MSLQRFCSQFVYSFNYPGGFQFFELTKLPDGINEKDSQLLWQSLFKANTEEEVEKIRAMEVPEMEQAINAYYTITASPEFQEIERLRVKARHDEAQVLHHPKRERDIEIAKAMMADDEPIDKIAKYTGLTQKEIEALA